METETASYHCQEAECLSSSFWIVYFNKPRRITITEGAIPPEYLYLCTQHTVLRMEFNSRTDPFRIVNIRFLPDSMNQMAHTGVLASLPKRFGE